MYIYIFICEYLSFLVFGGAHHRLFHGGENEDIPSA
jgi:hypothetical protein